LYSWEVVKRKRLREEKMKGKRNWKYNNRKSENEQRANHHAFEAYRCQFVTTASLVKQTSNSCNHIFF